MIFKMLHSNNLQRKGMNERKLMRHFNVFIVLCMYVFMYSMSYSTEFWNLRLGFRWEIGICFIFLDFRKGNPLKQWSYCIAITASSGSPARAVERTDRVISPPFPTMKVGLILNHLWPSQFPKMNHSQCIAKETLRIYKGNEIASCFHIIWLYNGQKWTFYSKWK